MLVILCIVYTVYICISHKNSFTEIDVNICRYEYMYAVLITNYKSVTTKTFPSEKSKMVFQCEMRENAGMA